MTTSTSERSARTTTRVPRQRRAAVTESRPLPSSGLKVLPALTFGLDLFLISVAVVLASVSRNHLGPLTDSGPDTVPGVAVAAPAMIASWIAAITVLGGYRLSLLGAGTEEFKRVLHSVFVAAALAGITCYLLRFDLSRAFFVLTLLIGSVLLLGGRVTLRLCLSRAREHGHLQSRVLLVGDASHVDEIASVLAREPRLGYRAIGALTPGSARGHTDGGMPVVGDTAHVAARAQELDADVLFFAGGAVTSASQLRTIAWELDDSHTQVVVAPSLTDVSSERITVRPVGGLPLIHLEKSRAAAAARSAKRTFDLVGSLLLLLALSPVIAFSAFRIRRFDRGPVLFKQERIGRDGHPFACWKFRTMVTDAEQLLAGVHSEQGSEQGVFAKIKDDPRVTPPGSWLRRLSLDELPQLVNVLRGEMSLVGPRPQVAHEVALYDDAMARRLHVRPGMTGLWQVSGRSDLSVAEAIRLDLYYVDNWSMVQDLSILARTINAVLGSRGAY